ncbi:MAG: hypothetical protein RLZZ630_324 [Bacteroidota bacterium]|jgi:hypothetical protein
MNIEVSSISKYFKYLCGSWLQTRSPETPQADEVGTASESATGSHGMFVRSV